MTIRAPEEQAPGGLTMSVVICAFTMDRWDVLGRALASVRGQWYAAGQTILVIDHEPMLEEAARAAWPDVLVVANRETQGLSGARNSGLAETTGDVVAFLDDDAIAEPDWLERLAATYADERVIGAGGSVRPRWLDGRPRWFPPEFDWVVGCSHSGMPRTPERVRNLIGANMSFRREVLVRSGGFRHELGRVGTIPAGCEETELCIRLGSSRPEGMIVYDPAAAVDHFVPGTRGRMRYFLSRCAAEGRSKAILAGLVGTEAGLAAERSYVRRTLPLGVLRGLGETARGRPSGAARSATLALGLMATAYGYLDARRSRAGPQPADAAPDDAPLRVLMVTPRSPLEHGGVERHVMEVSRRLVRDGVTVKVLCGDPGGPAIDERRHDGVTIRSVRAWPAHRDYYLAPRIWREMAREPWDVIHVQSYHTLITPLAMARALTLGIPYVVTFHGGGHSSVLRHSLRGAQRRAMRHLLAKSSRLVALARFEIEQYGRELHLPPEKFVLIPNGSDLTPVRSPESDRVSPRSGLLASIGRLERYKGHHRVIAALPGVLERRPDAHLMIVGTGPYEAALRRLAADLGVASHVEFTQVAPTDREGMVRLLERIALVVLLSDFETQPLVALEAAAAGRPLLVADRAGLGELARNGVARAVALNDPPETIARAIVEELERPRPAQPLSLTSWDECTAVLLELYRSVR